MQVTILGDISDTAHSYRAGDVVDMADEQAKRWIDAGYAVAGGEHPHPGEHPGGGPEQAARHGGHKR